MNLYLVLDLSVSLAQNVDHEKCVKIQRAFRFAETLITEIDKNEVTVHLVSYSFLKQHNLLILDLPRGFTNYGKSWYKRCVVGSFIIQKVSCFYLKINLSLNLVQLLQRPTSRFWSRPITKLSET